ncbi:hypothetical protein ACL02S_19410 [Nocardia sp. 004]|uniref:hypothetical protein n=1 Tax=Nocardia sp. 004 TaxID=3385978 RepID=UPI0039A1C3EB
MKRTIGALAAGATLFTLFLTGCGDGEADDNATSATTSAAAAAPATSTRIDQVRAGAFIVSFHSAFPQFAAGKDDAKIASILSGTCADLAAGGSEDEAVQNIVERAGGATEPSMEEARAIYQMAALMC